MPKLHVPFPVALIGMLALSTAGLGWLLFGFASGEEGRVSVLPAGASQASSLAEIAGFVEGPPTLTIAEVHALPPDAWRTPKRNEQFLDGNFVLWLRATVRNPGARPATGILAADYFFIDRCDAWWAETTEAGLTFVHQVAGEKIPDREKSVRGREAAVEVPVPAQGERTVYLRINDAGGGSLRFGWWPEAHDFFTTRSRTLLADGIYIGGLLALLGYNLVLWLRLRFVDTGFYLLYLGMMLVFVVLARGHLAMLGWPLGSPGLETIIAVATAASGLFLTQFGRVFLQLPALFPRENRLVAALQVMLGLLTAGALTIPWTDYSWWMRLVSIGTALTHAVMLVVAIRAWRAGQRQARFFILSFGCLFAGALPLVVSWLAGGYVPHSGMFGLMIGSALEMLMLSLALADRFVKAQSDKVAAQTTLIEEIEQRRAIQEAYADELAVEVRERTKELQASNTDKDRMIAVLGHDLRSPLTGLTQTAEKLSGVQVTSPALLRFAEDAAATGRQALLLIEDLVLWARLRAGANPPMGAHEARAVIAPVIALHRALAAQRGIELVTHTPIPLPVATDLVLAQTLVRNLVANALKFARTHVTVGAEAGPGGVRFAVRDDGAGLPAALVAALVSATPAIELQNSGIGLRLCVEIGHALGTRLVVATPDGGGTEFSFVLPGGTGAAGEKLIS